MQTESTLWRLKFFVKDALENQGKSSGSTSISGNKNNSATITGPSNNNNTNNNNDNMTNKNKQRKREISDAIAKAAKKKSKKMGSWSYHSMNYRSQHRVFCQWPLSLRFLELEKRDRQSSFGGKPDRVVHSLRIIGSNLQ